MTTKQNDSLICDKTINHDNSGVGHNFRSIDARDLPANIVEEIAAEILDGGNDSCDCYVASNGQHFRW